MRRRTALLALATLLAVAGGCSREAARPSPPAAAPAPANLLILTIDTLRPDALGWVSGANDTPDLDRLAAEGFAFPGAVAPAPLTLPSHVTLMTGLLPRRTGVRDNGQALGLGPPTLAERLAAAGWSTAAFVGGDPLAARFGLARGFATYDDHLTAGEGEWQERPAAATVAAAVAWLATAREPWFLWVHLYDPHFPYDPPAEFRRPGPRGAYDGEVAAASAAAGRLLAAIQARRQAGGGEALTVFAGDHGESLGEHGEATHGFFVYDSTVLVPLVFRLPGRVAPARSQAPARLVDVTPTVLELLGVPLAAADREGGGSGEGHLDGVSLAPLLAGGAQEVPPAYVETVQPWTSYGWAPLRAVRTADWKLIAAPRPELYDLAADPGELENLFTARRDRAGELRRVLRDVEAQPARWGAAAGDPETVAKLRALGYTGGATDTGEPPADRPDPKDRMALHELLTEGGELLEHGRLDDAIARFEQALAVEPENRYALSRLGRANLRKGESRAALDRLERAVAAGAGDAQTRTLLAEALIAAGQPDRAVGEWMAVVDLQPANARAWSNLGATLGLSGRPADALGAYERAEALDPESFEHSGAVGLLLLQLGRTEEARPWLERSRPGEPEYAEARRRLAELG